MGMGSCGVSSLTDALKRQHHTGKAKALTQKISRHLVLNRDSIEQEAHFLDDELVVGGEGCVIAKCFETFVENCLEQFSVCCRCNSMEVAGV